MATSNNDALIQIIGDGGLVVRSVASWWSRLLSRLFASKRWEKVGTKRVSITVAEIEPDGEVGGYIALVNADVEVCRYTGDRRYGRTCIYTAPADAAMPVPMIPQLQYQ